MEEHRAFGFRVRPRFSEVLEYIEEGEPSFGIPLPNRNASIYRSSHFYLDEFPQSTQPLAENPRPHTQLGAAIENDFESAEDGYQGRPFPQLQRPSFLQPGSDTDTEDEAYRRDGFDPPHLPQPPDPGQPSSSFSGRLGEAAAAGLTSIIAAGASGVGQAAQNFGFRNAARAANAVEQRVFPQIIGRPTNTQRVIEQAGQRAQEIQKAAAQDIEQFVAEQAAAETADITPLLAETAVGAGEAAGVVALLFLQPLVWLLELEEPWPLAWADQRRAHKQPLQVVAGLQPLPWRFRNLGRAGGAAVGGLGAATLGLGLGAVGGAYEGARYMLGGNAAMAVRQTIKRPTSTCNKGPRSNRSA